MARTPHPRDIRDIFLELQKGEVALTRRAERQALTAIQNNGAAWNVFFALVYAMRNNSSWNRRLLLKLHTEVVRHNGNLGARRVRLAQTIERAGRFFHGQDVACDEDKAVDAVCAVVHIELGRFEQTRSGDQDDDTAFWEWPRRFVRRLLVRMTLQDQSRPVNKRGGRDKLGANAIAAALSRKFQLFGDEREEANDVVAERFKVARDRVRKGG